MVVVLVPVGSTGTFDGPPVPSPSVGSANAGVGSNGIQPAPLDPHLGPRVRVAVRDVPQAVGLERPGLVADGDACGSPTTRASAANDAANCSQNPLALVQQELGRCASA